MNVITEDGRLFGLINVIDFLAVVVIIALAVAGASFVFGGGETAVATETERVVVETTVPERYGDAIYAGDSIDEDVERIVRIDRVGERYQVPTDSNAVQTVGIYHLHADLIVSAPADDRLQFRGERLVVGRELAIDLGVIIVEGDVISIGRWSDGGGSA